ncbi:SLATT domain-containing protein [Actinacidiphila oryziradicis]|uniref:SLATT domain-containing protein n=2 Tax=Actinacidiphila oryziradicis TaxID=2571141 RepID=A0A4U0RZX5_9ACTN|nr:SLATT domain-containing protein [Actinacidiphila oryziradicis]
MSPRRTAQTEPWEHASDPALAYAMDQLDWLRRAKRRARVFTQAGDFLTLLSTAATVVVSALSAPAAISASLAAVALFLTGFRQAFNPNERWVTAGVSWLALHQAVVRYRLTPQAARDDAARQALIDRTVEISAAENRAWAEQRRATQPLPPGTSLNDAQAAPGATSSPGS